VRSTNKDILGAAQDGGGVTSLLAYALKEGKIDCAVATGVSEDEAWRPQPVIAKTVDELIGTAGSKYTPCPTLIGLKFAVGRHDGKKVAVAGLPCHIWAIRKMQILPENRPAIVDAIGFTING
jgi:coenzyme F420 hydrogenase subunit beta